MTSNKSLNTQESKQMEKLKMSLMMSGGGRLAIVAIVFQVIMLIIFGILVEYGPATAPIGAANGTAKAPAGESLGGVKYSMFQDVHVMIFVGFGFLMTFLKRYGFSAVGFNFLISALAIQWSILIAGLLHLDAKHTTITLDIESLLGADFATAAVLISFGAVLGKTTGTQLLVMTIIEIVLFNVNELIGRKYLGAEDAGDSIFVHAFGAYFGIVVARVLFKPDHVEHSKEGSVYHSDLFAMIGSLFLWLFWPSFNSGGLEGNDRHRAIVNTYLALASCCVTSFAISAVVDKKGKINMVHVQNSTLAGGVAVGAIGNFVIQPWGAVLVGIVAAVVSVLGFQYLTPAMATRLGFHDTCGVHNLHGMPALVAALGSAIGAALATKESYGDSLATVFTLSGDAGWTPGKQAGYQLAALGVTLLFAIVGGAITGLVLRLPCWGSPVALFEDEEAWIIEEDEGQSEQKPAALADSA